MPIIRKRQVKIMRYYFFTKMGPDTTKCWPWCREMTLSVPNETDLQEGR